MSTAVLIALLVATFALGMSAGGYLALKIVFDAIRFDAPARRAVLRELGPWRRLFS